MLFWYILKYKKVIVWLFFHVSECCPCVSLGSATCGSPVLFSMIFMDFSVAEVSLNGTPSVIH